MNKKLSIIMLVFASFFITVICYISFATVLIVKLLMYGFFGIPAVIFFIIGIAVYPGNRRKAAGLTLFIGAGIALLATFNNYEVFHDPRYEGMVPDRYWQMFGDMQSGVLSSSVILAAGVVLFLLGLRQKKQQESRQESRNPEH